MADLPSGTVTFLFTDIEGSVALWEQDRQAMATALEQHHQLLRTAIEANHGVLFKIVGDAIQAAFPTAAAALTAALDGQHALLTQNWGGIGPLHVRMALHVGEAEPDDQGAYLTPVLNRLSRLLVSAHGGQVLLSHPVQQLARGELPAGAQLRDLGEHRLRDLHEPERIFQLLHPNLPSTFLPLRTLHNRPNNIPPEPTPFLGREREVGRVQELLHREGVRLLTLTGPGGVGKTRLALQAAADSLDNFPDGVFFVPLAPLTDPQLVPAAIADALGVRAEVGHSLVAAIAAFLLGKQQLLVLDNCEHVLPAATVVGELLAIPTLKILATSRASLRLRAEHELPVAPMDLPDPARLPDFNQLSQLDAVRLFVQQAQAINPDFALNNENAPAVAEICVRLDGLPLAIELAAARTKLMPPAALLKRLEKRLPMLTGGARDLPARQQTLRNAMTWSHDLLSQEEQTLFRRLAVFAGGCTIAAAEAVGNAAGDLDLFGGLSSLIEKNLVQQVATLSGDPRYLMLETIREYALEQLDDGGEGEAIRDAQATWCLTLVERWPAHMRYRLEGEHAELLAMDQENLRAALVWLYERQEWSRALRLAAALGSFWFVRGHLTEGRRWLERLLNYRDLVPCSIVADALTWTGVLTLFLGDLDAAAAAFDDALAAWQEAEDANGMAWTMLYRGAHAEFSGDEEAADARYHEALAHARNVGDLGAAAVALTSLGDDAFRRGDLDKAAALASEATIVARRGNLTSFLVLSLCTEAYVALARHEVERSLRIFGEGLAHTGRFTNPFFTADALAGLASATLAAGYAVRSTRLLGAVAAICERTGLTALGHDAQHRSAVALARQSLSSEEFTSAWEAGHALLPEEAVAEARVLVGEMVGNPGT